MAKRFEPFHPPQRILMGPGPSEVSPRVLAAMVRPTIGHLDPVFVDMMEEMKVLLRYAFRTENQLTMPVSAPGSTGMETCFVNLVEPGDKVVVCQNGVFGGRMKENVERAGGEAVMVQDDWGTAISVDKVADAFARHPEASLLAFVVGLLRLRKELIQPLARLEESVAKVCSGEPGANLPRGDELAFATTEGRVVGRKNHRHRGFVHSNTFQRLRILGIHQRISDGHLVEARQGDNIPSHSALDLHPAQALV